ncbi:MAG TPA: hypothetical protein VII94_00960 [Candidatus Saccharimonadales bacterium]
MKINVFEKFFGDEGNKVAQLDLDKIKENIPQFSSEKLCEMIICDRYFGFEQKIAVLCMTELASRRTNGDTFNFEDYIEEKYKELPVLNFEMPDLRTVLQQAASMAKKVKAE